jgi:hypothetical protein
MRLAVFFLALATALPAWANFQSLEILGWSSDEQRFALRLYDEEDSEGEEGKPYCPGYVDHQGQSFHGSLKLGVYEQGKKPTWFPIQDSGKCTPPKKARERLDKAKQELARLGIDLSQKQPGTRLGPNAKGQVTVNEGSGAPYTFEYEQQVKTSVKDKGRTQKAKTQEDEEEALEDEFRVNEMKGELVVFVRKGDARTKLFSEPVYATFIPGHGEQHDVRLANVWLSPSGKRAVFISATHDGHPRDSKHTLRILGMVSVDGMPVVLR